MCASPSVHIQPSSLNQKERDAHAANKRLSNFNAYVGVIWRLRVVGKTERMGFVDYRDLLGRLFRPSSESDGWASSSALFTAAAEFCLPHASQLLSILCYFCATNLCLSVFNRDVRIVRPLRRPRGSLWPGFGQFAGRALDLF